MTHRLAALGRGSLISRSAQLSLLMLVAAAIPLQEALAAELIMFSQRGCPWCIRWHKEIGPLYPASPEGRYAPLREVDIRDSVPGIQLKKPVTITPTFVLVDNGNEVGRVTGYPGDEFFWELLAEILPESFEGTWSSKKAAEKPDSSTPPHAAKRP